MYFPRLAERVGFLKGNDEEGGKKVMGYFDEREARAVKAAEIRDDEIAEFFDETGKETSEVPDSRHITISIWIRKNVIYNPAVAVRN